MSDKAVEFETFYAKIGKSGRLMFRLFAVTTWAFYYSYHLCVYSCKKLAIQIDDKGKELIDGYLEELKGEGGKMSKTRCECGRGINQPEKTGDSCHRCVNQLRDDVKPLTAMTPDEALLMGTTMMMAAKRRGQKPYGQ